MICGNSEVSVVNLDDFNGISTDFWVSGKGEVETTDGFYVDYLDFFCERTGSTIFLEMCDYCILGVFCNESGGDLD